MCWPTRRSPFAGVLALVGFSVPHFVAVRSERVSAPILHFPTPCPLRPRPPQPSVVLRVAVVRDAQCIAAFCSQSRCTGDSTAPQAVPPSHTPPPFQLPCSPLPPPW